MVHNYTNGNSFYGQDTWRVRKNLTVTFGLRYELFSPLLNQQNQLSNFTAGQRRGVGHRCAECFGLVTRGR